MAAEIRDLENQLYEYDHEYRLLEQELETLRRQNATLKSPQALAKPRGSSSSDSLQFEPRGSSPVKPAPALEAEEVPLAPKSVLEDVPESPPPLPLSPFSSDELPSPRLLAPSADQPSSSGTNGTAPSRFAPPSGPLPKSPPADLRSPRNGAPSGIEEFNLDDLLPPTIDPGEPMPPPLPSVSQNAGQRAAPEDDLEMNLSRIELPGMLASHPSGKDANIQAVAEPVTDMRVVELALHPTLSRAINLDDRNDDDGLYLVLQPKNVTGQMVPVTADLSIAVLDPARDGKQAQIGRWDYSAAEVQAHLRPIGTSQGIHLTLPWRGPRPSADRVIVFALYKFENGRQVMGEKEIFVSNDGGYKTVWAPRAKVNLQSPGQSNTAVSPASLGDPATSSQPANVVRPASGTSPAFDPAPAPSLQF